MPTLSVLVSTASLLSLFTQSPNTEVLATSPPPEGQGISEKPYAVLHVTMFARLSAWIPSPMSDPRLTVAQFYFVVLGVESMVLYTSSHIP